jgi:hypothetical protein
VQSVTTAPLRVLLVDDDEDDQVGDARMGEKL